MVLLSRSTNQTACAASSERVLRGGVRVAGGDDDDESASLNACGSDAHALRGCAVVLLSRSTTLNACAESRERVLHDGVDVAGNDDDDESASLNACGNDARALRKYAVVLLSPNATFNGDGNGNVSSNTATTTLGPRRPQLPRSTPPPPSSPSRLLRLLFFSLSLRRSPVARASDPETRAPREPAAAAAAAAAAATVPQRD